MKKFFAILAVAGFMVACNDSATTDTKPAGDTTKTEGVADAAQKAADTANKTMTNAADTAKKIMDKAADTAKKVMDKAIDKAADKAKGEMKKN
jgi:F0F1-type ATP synthase membrane subunit b/b'